MSDDPKNPQMTVPAKPFKLYHVTFQGITTQIEAEDEFHARRLRTGDGDGPNPRDVLVVEIERPKVADTIPAKV